MPKVNGRYKKKPSIPNYNPQVLKVGQISRADVNMVKSMQSKSNAGSHNLRKSQ